METPTRAKAFPLPALCALFVAVLAMASGGLWFALLPESPPLMKACWRLTLTATLQGAGFFHQSRGLPAAFWARFRDAIPHLIFIGFSLALHFGSWGWSVDHTSLVHSLLLVWSTPLIIVAWMFARSGAAAEWVRARMRSGAQQLVESGGEGEQPPPPLPPTAHEALGAVLGFAGVAVLLGAGAERAGAEAEVTLAGDAAALLGAAAIIPYLQGGAELRAWMPLFVYALPVTGCAAAWLAAGSLLTERGASVGGVGPGALLGFLGAPRRAGLALGAAAVSGILGHTLVNFALRHLPPLLISVACLWEPVLGSVLGWLVGVQGPPSAMTLLAAPLLLGGGLCVTLGARDAEPLPCCVGCRREQAAAAPGGRAQS